MSASVLGALRVIIGGDNSSLDKSLKDSQSSLTQFSNTMRIGLEAVALASIAAGAALGVMIKHAIDNADQMNKVSQSTGMTVEELSKLKYAADLSDVGMEALSKSVVKLSKAMASAGADGAGEAGRAFAAMGVSVKNQDGTLRSSSDVLGDVAEKFSGYRDGAEKTTLAVALFGKAGAAMIPLLNQGRDGLKESGDEAERFGLVLSKSTTDAAEAFNDNLRRMKAIQEGLVTQLTAKLLPTFLQLSEVMLDSRKNTEVMSAVSDGLASAIKGAVTVGLSAVVVFQRLAGEIVAFWNVLNAPDWSSLKTAWAEFGNQEKLTDEALKGLSATVSNLWDNTKKGAYETAAAWEGQIVDMKTMQREVVLLGDAWKQAAPNTAAAATAARTALQSFLDGQAKRIAGQEAEVATIGKSVGEQAKLRVQYEAQAIALARGLVLSDAMTQKIALMGDAAALAAMKLSAANTAQQVMSPAEKYAQDLTQLQQVYASTDMTAQTFATRQQQLAEGVGATWEQSFSGAASGFGALATQFGKGSSDMANAAKAFGIIEATINTYTAFTKALAGSPPPFNYVAAAGTLAAGMAKVAAIKSQSIPTGMMTGGSMTVRGSGGPDSVPVNMMLSPGEQVDVWRPEQGGGADPRRGGGGAQTVTVNFNGVVGKDGLSRLFDEMNEMFSDGYRLKIA